MCYIKMCKAYLIARKRTTQGNYKFEKIINNHFNITESSNLCFIVII